jgi:chromosome partitioning protein
MIIAFVNQKGGTGKSTSAIHLVYWLMQRGSVILVDADAQNSSSAWAETLEMPFQIISDPEEIFDALPNLAKEYDHVVVDGPGGMSEISKAILSRCELALVPCQPSGLDLRSSNKTLRFISQAQELRQGAPKAFLYLNRATKGTILLRESRQVLAESSIPTLETVIHQRQCLADAPGQNITAFQMSGAMAASSASEFDSLFTEVFSHAGIEMKASTKTTTSSKPTKSRAQSKSKSKSSKSKSTKSKAS